MRDNILTTRTVRIAVVVVVLASLTGLVAVGVGAQDDGGDWSLGELRNDGKHISEMNPSERPVGGSTTAALLDYPAKPWVEFGGNSYDQVEPSTTVQRNRVMLYLRSFDTEERDLTVHVVYWREGTREVERNGTVVEEPEAVDVVHDTQEITVSGRETLAEVDLRAHYNEHTRVTMWIEGNREEARWTFSHRSSDLMMPLNLQTAGDALMWGALSFLLPSIGGVVLAWPVGKLVEQRMLIGPMKDRRWWAKIGVMGGFVSVVWFWDGVASLLVSMRWVTGIFTFVLAIGMVLDNQDRVDLINFRQLMTSEGVVISDQKDEDEDVDDEDNSPRLPLRATRVDPNIARVIEHKGAYYVVAPGARRALARLVAGAAKIDEDCWDAIENRIEAKTGGSYDEEIPLDARSEDPLSLEFPKLRISLPDEDDLSVRYVSRLGLAGAFAVTLGAVGAQVAWDAPTLGWTALAPVVAWAVVGGNTPSCQFEPAPVMQQQAETTNTLLSRDYSEAQTNDELRRKLREKDAEAEAERIDEDENRRRTSTDKILESRGADFDRLSESEREAMERARAADREQNGNGDDQEQEQEVAG